MTRTMSLYETRQFEHKEVRRIYYKYTSLSVEYEIAHRLGKECDGDCFINILDGDGFPVKSLEVPL